MIFEQHYLDCLSQASYFIGDESTGRAVVVDPRRDIAPYLESAAEHSMTIEMVLETHFHADFLSGHLEVAEATGAVIAYGSVAETEFESRKLAHGERIELGQVVLEIRHTPGHTPESISIVVYENADDAVPYGVLTGDTMFVGDVGRPDLLSSKGVTSEELASQLYRSLQNQLLTLPDATKVYPAHGAGSSCGKNLSSDTWSTIGQQRETNYALAPMTEEDFVSVVTEGQTAPPAYFSFDAMLNRELRPLLDEATPPQALSLAETLEHQRAGATVLDARDPQEFALGHLIGSVNIGMTGRYAEFAGGVLQPGAPIVLIVDDGLELEAKNRLARIGFDSVIGFLQNPTVAMSENPGDVKQGSRVDVAGLRQAMDSIDGLQVVDVRQPGETQIGVIEGATVLPLTQMNQGLSSLDASKPTIVYCAGGFRSSIAASRMAQAGFSDVSDLLGGYGALGVGPRRRLTPVRPPSTGDIVAGLSVALVAIPQSLAYADLAGLPPQNGLYASALPAVFAALFVSSRHLQTGPVALTSLLTFGALAGLGTSFSPEYVKLAALLALMVGGFRLVLGVVKLGRLAYLLSDPVLTGFTTGAAVLIISSQLPKLFDAETDGRGVLADAVVAAVRFDRWHWQAVAFGAGTAIVIVGGRRLHRLFPGVLLAVGGATIVSGLTGYNGSVAGELAGGFVSPSIDLPWSAASDLVIPAFVIALVGFAEPSSIARTFAAEDRLPWDADREMVGQGVANVVAGLTQAFPVGGSFSRSSLSRLAGATSPWAGAITGLFVLLALPLTPLLSDLPGAVLGAIVLVSVVGLLKFGDLIRLVRQSRPQAVVAFGTFIATLAFAPRVERGVLMGIVLAMGVHLYREMTVSADSARLGDTLTVSPKGVVWFATVPNVDRLIRHELADHPDLSTVVIDLGGVGRLDFSGAAALARIIEEVQLGGCEVRVENVPPGAARAVSVHLSANRA